MLKKKMNLGICIPTGDVLYLVALAGTGAEVLVIDLSIVDSVHA